MGVSSKNNLSWFLEILRYMKLSYFFLSKHSLTSFNLNSLNSVDLVEVFYIFLKSLTKNYLFKKVFDYSLIFILKLICFFLSEMSKPPKGFSHVDVYFLITSSGSGASQFSEGDGRASGAGIGPGRGDRQPALNGQRSEWSDMTLFFPP